MKLVSFLFISNLAAFSQQIDTTRIGCIANRSGGLWDLLGVRGNFIIGGKSDTARCPEGEVSVEGGRQALRWPDGATVFEREDGIWYRAARGEERRIDIPVGPLRWIAPDWVQCGLFAIERRDDRIDIYVLPEAAE